MPAFLQLLTRRNSRRDSCWALQVSRRRPYPVDGPDVLDVAAGALMIFLEDPGRPTGLGSTNRNIFEMKQNAINNSRKITLVCFLKRVVATENVTQREQTERETRY